MPREAARRERRAKRAQGVKRKRDGGAEADGGRRDGRETHKAAAARLGLDGRLTRGGGRDL